MTNMPNVADGLLVSLAKSFLETPDRELGSIISSARRETEILDNPYIAASLSAAGPGKEVDFSYWHKGNMTVFLSLSAPKFPVFSRWLRLVLTSALDEMTDLLRPPPRPVCFVLDECAQLGHMKQLAEAVSLSAGYGVRSFTSGRIWPRCATSTKTAGPRSSATRASGWCSTSMTTTRRPIGRGLSAATS